MHIAVVAMATLVLAGVGLAVPRLIREDGVYESTGALAFALAAVLVAWICSTRWFDLDGLEKLCFPAVGVASALAFLSEVSFGSRAFGWSMPKMSGGGELDGVHDFAIVAVRWARAASASSLAMAGAAVAAAVLACAYLARDLIAALVRRALKDPVFFGLFVSTALLAGAVGLDTLHTRRVEAFEEAFETMASFSVFVAMVRRLARFPAR